MPASPIQTRRAVFFLLTHLRRHAVYLALGFTVLVAVDILQLVIPRIIQSVLDGLGESRYSRAAVVSGGAAIAALATAMVVLRFLWRLFIVKPSRQIEERMRLDMFGRLEELSTSFFDRSRTGDLMALFVNDVGAVRMATGMALIGLFDAVFMSIMSLAFMTAIDLRLTLVTAAPLPVIVLLIVKTGRLIESRFTAVQEGFASISAETQEAFSGIRVIKGLAREDSEHARFAAACGGYVERNLSLTRVWGLIFPSITFLASVSFSLLLLFGGRAVLKRDLTIGEFVSFTFYINLLVWPMIATGWVWNLFQRGIASAKRIMELLETEPDVRTEPEAARGGGLPARGFRIEFRNLTFRYAGEGPAALQDLSLDIPAGSSLGIIGRPGSGKTTLVSLLLRLYPVERGRLFIDGRDINDVEPATLRSAAAYVPQDAFLFSDTVEANIAFPLEETEGRGAVREAAELAAVHRDIEGFAAGYGTRIGERGVMLSGGQKQRIAIARAFAARRNRALLVLDDALSSVDAATEAAVLQNLRGIMNGRTALIIAHRISTVRRCDAVMVLEGGRIAEYGTHETLCKGGGFYSRLWELQRMKWGAQT